MQIRLICREFLNIIFNIHNSQIKFYTYKFHERINDYYYYYYDITTTASITNIID
jgi:hypothetical protein